VCQITTRRVYFSSSRILPAWNPYQLTYIEEIEKVQKKFTRMMYYKFHWIKPKYEIRLRQLKMQSLESRRLQLDEITLYKIIHGRIDTNLISRIKYHTPEFTTRQNRTFHLPVMSATSVQGNSPMVRLQRNHDIYFSAIDIINTTLPQFKLQVKNYFKF